MDFYDSLQGKNSRRQFVSFCILAAIVVLGAHIVLTLLAQKSGASGTKLALLEAATLLTGGLFAGVITASFLLFVAQYLYPIEQTLKAVGYIDPKTTLDLHRKALSVTDFWLHSGHIGRWVRVHAIPALAATARERGISTRVVLYIIDPNDLELCKRYSDYRTLIKYQERGFATIEDTRAELLATVIATCVAKSESPRLHVEVYFRRSINYTRFDVSSTMAFHTIIDPRSPAVVYRNIDGHREHTFYQALKLSLEDEFGYAHRFVPVGILSSADLDADHVSTFLLDNGFGSLANAEFVEQVIRRLRSVYTPYE